MKTGVLLINLGTPEQPDKEAVRTYLKEFLSDPRVIDIHPIARWLLVHLFILPFRSRRSAEAYRKIWSTQGSPLLHHSEALTYAVGKELGDRYLVKLGMRYGNPSIASALNFLLEHSISSLKIVPLYPQYASSSTGTALEKVLQHLAKATNIPTLTSTPPFYQDSGFLESYAALGRPLLQQMKPDHVLFSFHGLPERHIVQSDPSGNHCLEKFDCCELMNDQNQFCYRAHVYQTTQALAQKLALPPDTYSLSFQSRLGRTPWLQPYTDKVIPQLARKGKKRLLVFCPSFVADCLETLEEIGIRAKESFLENGGTSFTLVPCLNSSPGWVSAVAHLIQKSGD